MQIGCRKNDYTTWADWKSKEKSSLSISEKYGYVKWEQFHLGFPIRLTSVLLLLIKKWFSKTSVNCNCKVVRVCE